MEDTTFVPLTTHITAEWLNGVNDYVIADTAATATLATTATNQSGGTVAATTGSFSGLVTLTSGQLKFPATQAASTDVNTLDDYEEGTFTGTFTGFSGTAPTIPFRYVKVGKLVVITTGEGNYASGTSNATTKTMTGLPAGLYPGGTINVFLPSWNVSDNGGTHVYGRTYLNVSGVVVIDPTSAFGSWTASGTAELLPTTFSYSI